MDDRTPSSIEGMPKDEALQAEIDRHRKAEAALQATVDGLRAVLSRIAEAFFTLEPEGRLLEMNDEKDLEVFLHAISERKELENAFRESYHEIEAREQELLRQLAIAGEALQKKTEAQELLERRLNQFEEQNDAALIQTQTAPEAPLPGRSAELRRVLATRARFQRAIFRANQKFTSANARLSAGNRRLGQHNIRLGEELDKRRRLMERLEEQKKQLDNQNRLLSIIFETSPAGIALLSVEPEPVFRYVNPAFRRLTPHPHLDPLNRRLDEVLSLTEAAEAHQVIQRVIDGQEPYHTSQYEHVFPDGAAHSYDTYLNPLEWEGQPAILAILWETTAMIEAQRRAETAAAQAQEYAARLESANQELRSFAFIASHDLQEPLRKIQAFAERLKSHAAGALDDTSLLFLDRIQNASARMQEMISGLLAYSRVHTHNLPFKTIDLGQVAREVLTDLEVSIEAAEAEITLAELPVIEADPLQMRQLLQNLIGNALKFRRPGIPARIQITSTFQSPDRVQIEIADNGIGFDPKHASLLFQPFSRLHGRVYEGTGMGLAICRKTVERHRGGISVESCPGMGTTFYVTLPVVQNSQSTTGWP
jgi:PAS domain S-box-containing protein